jgi:NAD(P)-dependent dehydrogenase (short-subunit alcohol dehydrogenase family)
MISEEKKELQAQVALITGAAGAIGRAISDGFLDAGACVTLVDFDQSRLEEFEQELSAKYEKANMLSVVADVKDSNQVKHAFEATVEKFGRLDIWLTMRLSHKLTRSMNFPMRISISSSILI